MKNLIERIQEKYDFKETEPTVIKGFSSTIIMKSYEYSTEYLKIVLSELHENNRTIKDRFRIYVTEDFDAENTYDAVTLFDFEDENKLFTFLELLEE